MTPTRIGLAIVACVVVAAACGTTVDPAQLAALEQNPAAGLDPTDPLGPTAPGGPGETTGPDGNGLPTDAPTIPGGGGPAPPGAGLPAVGVTARTIKIGMVYAVNGQVANDAGGATGATGISQLRQFHDIVVEDMNKHRGGIAGRTVKSVYGEVDSLSSEPISAQYQAICEQFTREERVYGATTGGTPNFKECMERAGAVMVQSDLGASGARTFQQFPHYVEIANPSLDRIANANVESLWRNDYFSGWDHNRGAPGPVPLKVGVVTFDSPEYDHALENALLPALARHGIEPEVRQVIEPERNQDFGTEAAQISNAVLYFKTNNITHVILLEANGNIALFFSRAADEQQYHPRYGLNMQSGNSALFTALPRGAIPAEEFVGALSIGWNELLDLAPADAEKIRPSATRARCVKLMQDHGVTFSSVNAQAIAVSTCDELWFLEYVVERGSPGAAITTDSWLNGLQSIGSSYIPGSIFGTSFGPAKHDGGAQVADLEFVLDCECFRYTSEPYAIP